MRVSNFGRFFDLQGEVSTYMHIDLYASTYGISKQQLLVRQYENGN